MNITQRVKSYLKYRWTCKTHQRIHSPFVFQLLKDVFYQNTLDHSNIRSIENRRQELLKTGDTIQVTDLGAGQWKTSERKISDIANNSLKRKIYAQLIYRITHHFQPKVTLELGTSLGITTSYIGQGYRDGKVVTIEGCPNIAQIAQKTFQTTQTQNIDAFVGGFDQVLPEVFKKYTSLDIVFIDGNHAYAPTIQYFNDTLKYAHNDTVFIFDDIHWSEEMERAWKDIQAHPLVTTTIDIYEMGIVFIRKEQKVKEHFTIKYPL